jgi:uncharacterized protein YbjT (DUF2867 family)
MSKGNIKRVLLTGATGFVGSALYPLLVEAGYDVICTSRDPKKASHLYPDRSWRRMSVDEPRTIAAAMKDCDAAYYLVHQIKQGPGYEEREHSGAESFISEAERNDLERVVYLGGIEPRGAPSQHLRSRLHTGQILRSTSVSTIELRASVIIGPGSESWEVIRDLAARLPIFALPDWAETKTQPVFIDDVLEALKVALSLEGSKSRVYDIPGPDLLTVREILLKTAEMMGHRPEVIRVPFIQPQMARGVLQYITGADGYLAGELLEGLSSDLTAREDNVFWDKIAYTQRCPFEHAVQLTLSRQKQRRSIPVEIYEWLINRVNRIEGGR